LHPQLNYTNRLEKKGDSYAHLVVHGQIAWLQRVQEDNYTLLREAEPNFGDILFDSGEIPPPEVACLKYYQAAKKIPICSKVIMSKFQVEWRRGR